MDVARLDPDISTVGGRLRPREVLLRLVTDMRIGFEGPGAHATKTLRTGDRAYVAMVWARSRHSIGKEY